MKVNELPHYDMSDNPTGCCPRFNPDAWEGQELHFKDKNFVRATTRSAMHIPLNMGRVFTRVQKHIEDADAFDEHDYIVLSKDISSWKGDHYFAVTKPVPDEDMVTLSGDYITHVYEGPYREAKEWYDDMQKRVGARGKEDGEIYFFYTTCPKCAKVYGQNFVVGVGEI